MTSSGGHSGSVVSNMTDVGRGRSLERSGLWWREVRGVGRVGLGWFKMGLARGSSWIGLGEGWVLLQGGLGLGFILDGGVCT